jgi:hypothetical protein
MKVHALQTGTVRVKNSFLHPSSGRRRQLDLFLPGAWSEPLPIHCWAIEHDGTILLVDSGETDGAKRPLRPLRHHRRAGVARRACRGGTVHRPTSPGSCSLTITATTPTVSFTSPRPCESTMPS